MCPLLLACVYISVGCGVGGGGGGRPAHVCSQLSTFQHFRNETMQQLLERAVPEIEQHYVDLIDSEINSYQKGCS